jgi:hypothetical protein
MNEAQLSSSSCLLLQHQPEALRAHIHGGRILLWGEAVVVWLSI